MNTIEIEKEIGMPYEKLCDYLVQKYGPATYNYFANETCASKNKQVTRTSEGLYCHHRREDKAPRLSNSDMAIIYPFEWQLKENLVYCNLLEHLILHIKIAVLCNERIIQRPSDICSFWSNGGIFEICRDIVELMKSENISVAWQKRCFEEIQSNYIDYIEIINAFFIFIETHYAGDKLQDKKSSKLQKSFYDYEDMYRKRVCSGNNTFYDDIYTEMINHSKRNSIEYALSLEVDSKHMI